MVRRALAMAAGEQYLRLAIGFASIATVSRLLTPTEIGVSVIGTGIMADRARTARVRDIGLPDPASAGRAATTSAARSRSLFLLTALIAAAMFLLAPWFGALYGEEKLARSCGSPPSPD